MGIVVEDRRRKLTPYDYMKIQECIEDESIAHIARRFDVHKNWVKRLLRKQTKFCLFCNRWKKEGRVERDEFGRRYFACADCLASSSSRNS